MAKDDIIEIDGRTGEGGGQILRIAVGLAAVTTQAVRITNIRGNRPRGGGLKNQHFTAIQWLAEVTDADVKGLSVGSKTLEFRPRLSPSQLSQRNFTLTAPSGAASTLLIFQAILPFLVFVGNSSDDPVRLRISGGTNVSFSPTFEYLDQVLLPTLEDRFSINVKRELKRRAWSLGPLSRGEIWLIIHPLSAGEKLQFIAPKLQTPSEPEKIRTVDVSIVGPSASHEALQELFSKDLEELFPDVEINFKLVEDSRTDGRWYILLVARSANGFRWGHDVVCSMPKKTKSRDVFVQRLVRDLCKGLYKEFSIGGQADEHLQDQVVCFQALGEGLSSFPRNDLDGATAQVIDLTKNLSLNSDNLRRDKVERFDRPFGTGSLHTQSARWVVSRLLPRVEFFNDGEIVRGIGFSSAQSA